MFVFAALSGAPIALTLRRRWWLTELAAVTVIFSLIVWSLATPVLWKLHAGALLPFVPAAVAVCGWWLVVSRRIKTIEWSFSALDLVAIGFSTLIAACVAAVLVRNGPVFTGGAFYQARSWYVNDSFYLFSLVQNAVNTRRVPTINPFLSGEPNYYQSWVHCGLAGLTSQSGTVAALAVWRLTPLYALAAALLLPHVIARRGPLRANRTTISLVAAIGSVGLFLLRPDLSIFPQPQTFIFPIVLVFLWLLGRRLHAALRARNGLTVLLLFLLVLSHTVLSTVAIVVLLSELLIALWRKRIGLQFALIGVATFLAVVLFVHTNQLPYPPERGDGISKFAAYYFDINFVPCLIPAFVLLVAAIQSLRRAPNISIAVCGLVAIGVLWCLYAATRANFFFVNWFSFNAERFVYGAYLVALPLFLLIRRRTAISGFGIAIAAELLLPQHTARKTYQLAGAPAVTISADMATLLEWVRTQTSSDARFVSTNNVYWLPALTGHAQFSGYDSPHYGVGSIPMDGFTERMVADERILSLRVSQPERTQIMDQYGLTHLLLERNTTSSKQLIEALKAEPEFRTVCENSAGVILEKKE